MLVPLLIGVGVGLAGARLLGGSNLGDVPPGPDLSSVQITPAISGDAWRTMPVVQRRSYLEQRLGRAILRPTIGRYTKGEAEALLAGGLVGLNLYQLHKGVPGISEALHRGEVRYERRDPSERWKSLREIWEEPGPDGIPFEDCEGLAAAVAAERTFNGMPSQLILHPVRPGLSHAVVKDLRTGRLLDPSRTGGMGRA